jgi:hypothetical protein
MTDAFQALIDKYRARMVLLAVNFERDGYLYAVSRNDPGFAILLTQNGSSEAPWRDTSFLDRQPIGHREYDRLEGGSPIQNAFAEFAGGGMQLGRRSVDARMAAARQPV